MSKILDVKDDEARTLETHPDPTRTKEATDDEAPSDKEEKGDKKG